MNKENRFLKWMFVCLVVVVAAMVLHGCESVEYPDAEDRQEVFEPIGEQILCARYPDEDLCKQETK